MPAARAENSRRSRKPSREKSDSPCARREGPRQELGLRHRLRLVRERALEQARLQRHRVARVGDPGVEVIEQQAGTRAPGARLLEQLRVAGRQRGREVERRLGLLVAHLALDPGGDRRQRRPAAAAAEGEVHQVAEEEEAREDRRGETVLGDRVDEGVRGQQLAPRQAQVAARPEAHR